ncbi:AAA family ATPase [Seohaeicola saemankumensis]|uniref:AAA family ATPase n=1 Tax=Seohaeicola saemankumensis TaxID=481181 RepID=A0ABW3TFR2_9RHOB
MTVPAKEPKVLPVCADRIPPFLKGLNQWVVWGAVAKKGGRVNKVPIDPTTGLPVNAHDPQNHLSFNKALSAYQAGKADGVGIVLTGEPVRHEEDGQPVFLVGVDLDKVHADPERAAQLLRPLRGAYVERSPSGQGLRVFCLSHHKPHSGQGAGGEIYAQGRFLTVTGQSARGTIRDCTEGVQVLERLLWPEKTRHSENVVPFPNELFEVNQRIIRSGWVETPENITGVRNALTYIPPESEYDLWRSIIWAIASLNWTCGLEVAEKWSSGSAAHWNHDDGEEVRRAIAALFEQYRSDRGISIGTLYHHAYENGLPRPERPTSPLFALPDPTKPTASSNIQILSRGDLDALPPMRFTVPGVLPETGVAAIYGEPSSGKSFLAIDLAAKISSGNPTWFGRHVVSRDVVYVALEGGRGIQQRCQAWDVVNGSHAGKLKFVLSDLSLLDTDGVDSFIKAVMNACTPGAVIVIDTLAQATAGADENSAQDMGLVIKAAQAIATAISGLVLLVHHSGKDASRGLRGHSVLNGAMDAVINVERDRQTGRRSWRVTKMKDADDGASGQFELEGVALGTDKQGERVTSCAVRELTAISASSTGKPAMPTGQNQRAVFDALRARQDANKGWDRAIVNQIAKEALNSVQSQHRATRAKSAIEGLIDGGYINVDEGDIFHLTLPPDHPPPAPL